MSAAEITVQQLGGTRRLNIMIGAKNFTSDNDGRTLGFYFYGCRAANYVKITINANDLYDITFIRIKRKDSKVPFETVQEFENIHVDNLIETFENFTGLVLTL